MPVQETPAPGGAASIMMGVMTLLLVLPSLASRESVGAQIDEVRLHVSGLGDMVGTSDGVVDRFLGIRYAQPPVGFLRWSAPRAARPWTGVGSHSSSSTSQPRTAVHTVPLQLSTHSVIHTLSLAL